MILKLTNAEYHAHPAVSKSQLDKLARAPATLRAWLDGEREAPTAAMEFGTAFHAAVLEPHRIHVCPKFDKRTKEGKAAAQANEEKYSSPEFADAVIVDEETHRIITAMADAVMAHPAASRLLCDGEAEKSIFSEIDGVQVKSRFDFHSTKYGVVVDLKSTEDASPSAFARPCANYRYHVQHAFYLDVAASAGIEVTQFVFISVEKKPPHLVACYVLDARDVEQGRDTYRRDLETYKRCVETNEWPGYSDKIEVVSLPAWARTQQEIFL